MPPTRRKRKASNGTTEPKAKRAKPQRDSPQSTQDAASPAPEKPCYLERLPDELLLHILKKVDFLDIIQTSRSLSFTSRRLNRVANDVLYEWIPSHRVSFIKFLRSIISNRELAARVKSITYTQDCCFPFSEPPTSKDRRELRESLKNLSIPAKDRAGWEFFYMSAERVDLLTLIMLHTPNLQSFNMRGGPHVSRRTPFNMRRHVSSCEELLLDASRGEQVGKTPTYQHLHTLRMSARGLSTRDVYAILNLPSLKDCALDYINIVVDDGMFLVAEPASSSVQKLTIGSSFVPSEVIAQFIIACRALKHFEMWHTSMEYMHHFVSKIDYPKI